MSRSTGKISKTNTKAIVIPFDDVLEELEKLNNKSPEGFTTKEMSEDRKWSRELCRRKIKALIDAGLAMYAGERTVTNINNRAAKVPVYRLVNEK